MRRSVWGVVALAVLLASCSSMPRAFEPTLAAAPQSRQAYDQRLLFCRQQIAAAMDKKGRLASGAGGAAIGAGAGVAAGAATASAVPVMAGGAAAVAGMMIITAPLAGVFAAWGIAKMKRAQKERVIKAVMAKCLAEGGYQVAGFDALSKRQARELAAALKQANAAAPAQ